MTDALYDFYKIRSRMETIKKQHPRASEPILDINVDDLTQLIERIVKASPSDRPDIARLLKSKQATLLIHAYQRRLPLEAFEAITEVLRLRPVPRQLSQAWHILRNHPDLSPLQSAMAHIAKAIELPETNNDSHLSRLHDLWRSPDLYQHLVRDLASSTLPIDQWAHGAWRADQRPDDSFPIHHRIQAAVLCHGDREVLLRHALSDLERWFDSIPEALYDDATANYINSLTESEWADSVIENCISRHGLPAALGAFWRRIDERKRLIIQRRVAAKLIGDFFDGVNDPEYRFDYWKGFVDYLIDIAFPDSRARVMMVFKEAIVVEFRDINNAVYIYDRTDQSWVKRVVCGTGDNASCKDKSRAHATVNHHRRWRERMNYIMGQLT